MTKIPEDTDSVHQTAPVPCEVFTTRESLRERCEVALRCLPQAPMRDMLARLFEDLLAPQDASERWQLVPKEPTREMCLAAADAAREHMEQTGGNSPVVIYRAMLASAPRHRSADTERHGSDKPESAPSSSFAAQGMAQDAARYRHLRSRCPHWLLEEVFGGPIADSKREAQELLDAAIDSLRAVPHQPTGARNGE